MPYVKRPGVPDPPLPGQRCSIEGIVVCGCGHQALFHADCGCVWCGCRKRGDQFDYKACTPRRLVLAVYAEVTE